MAHEQLPLPLPAVVTYGTGDFIVTESNCDAVGWLEQWPAKGAVGTILYGPRGSGRTHLMRVWAEQVGAVVLQPEALIETSMQGGGGSRLAIDDVDMLLGAERPEEEEALFHLFNHVRWSGGRLLLTASAPASSWNIRLPDLASRLSACPSIEIQPPDDALLQAIMAKQFADRGVRVSSPLLAYLTTRIERSFVAVQQTVADLDRYALSKGRRLSRDLAREWMAERDGQV